MFCISIIKSLKKVYNNLIEIIIMEENMIVMTNPKSFCFNFDWPKDVDETWIIKWDLLKSNESLVEIVRKNKIEQLML